MRRGEKAWPGADSRTSESRESICRCAVILSGDFNAEPDSEEMKPLRETAGLVNATEGIGITFHNYHRDDPNDPQCSIDYIILKRGLGTEKGGKMDGAEGRCVPF